MDSIFHLGEPERATFLQEIMQTFNFTYICLWSYLQHPSDCLINLHGIYHERANQPSSSSGSPAKRLFDYYRHQGFNIDNGSVPGLAFKNLIPYMELNLTQLQRLSFMEKQMQFYQESGIKSAVFMGCNEGEIEFGISNDNQFDVEMEMMKMFPQNFSRQLTHGEILQPPLMDQTRPSPSSSLSIDSTEFSPLLFNISSNAYIPEPLSAPPPSIQTIQVSSQNSNINFPYKQSEDDAITQAMIAVISSSTSSSAASSSPLQLELTLPRNYQTPKRVPAFQRYRSSRIALAANTRRPNMFRRAVSFYRRLSSIQQQEQVQGSRPSSTQLNHMISERKRREKLNESFQSLRSMLPPGTKKDKASVLANTTEYLTSLKAQVEELSKKNKILEARILPREEAIEQVAEASNERVEVSVTHVPNPTIASTSTSISEARIVDLQVIVRGEYSMLDMVICLMEFLKQIKNVSVVSIDANTRMVESNSINRIVLRLRIEEGEWDESSFQEAIKRVVEDLA